MKEKPLDKLLEEFTIAIRDYIDINSSMQRSTRPTREELDELNLKASRVGKKRQAIHDYFDKNAIAEAVDGPVRQKRNVVWAVECVHDPHVQHGFEVVALFSAKELAEVCAEKCRKYQDDFNRSLDERNSISTRFHMEHRVTEWVIDDE